MPKVSFTTKDGTVVKFTAKAKGSKKASKGSKRASRKPSTWNCLVKRLSKQRHFDSFEDLTAAASKQYKKMSKAQQEAKGRCKSKRSKKSKASKKSKKSRK
jgi:NADH dehydrogenase/NADH:ubiquinone oxidoreductase subunit G